MEGANFGTDMLGAEPVCARTDGEKLAEVSAVEKPPLVMCNSCFAYSPVLTPVDVQSSRSHETQLQQWVAVLMHA